jgi:predicted methyltransferase
MKRTRCAVLSISILAGCAMPGTTMRRFRARRTAPCWTTPFASSRDRSFDERRHPVELLQFADVRPGMRVLDLVAGGGYTSQLLALAVGPSGKLWAQTPQVGNALKERMAAHPQAELHRGGAAVRRFRCRRKPCRWTS